MVPYSCWSHGICTPTIMKPLENHPTTKQIEGGSDKTLIVTPPFALPFQYIPKHKIIIRINIGEFPFEIHSPHPSLLDSQIYS